MNPQQAIEFHADLVVSTDNAKAAVTASGSNVSVRFESLRQGLAFWRRARQNFRSFSPSVLNRLVEQYGKTLTVSVGRYPVATVRPSLRGGALEKSFGLWPLRIRWGSVARGVFSGFRS